MRSFFIVVIASIFMLPSLISCKKKTESKDAKVSFSFNHYIDNHPLEFDTIKYSNEAGNHYGVSTLKYFVSDFVLTNTDGNSINFNGAFFVDAKEIENNTFISATTIPAGTYNKLSFIFGLNEDKNVNAAFPNPPENNMEWPIPLGGGYHYMKLEGKFDSVNTIKNYQAHTGRLMEVPHFINISISDLNLLIDGSDKTINLDMDINKWWIGPNTLDLNNISGIMGNEEIQTKLMENGSDIFSSRIE
jgi:hypothetical protein